MNRAVALGATLAVAIAVVVFVLSRGEEAPIRAADAVADVFNGGDGAAIVALTLHNDGDSADRLTGARADIAEGAAFHMHHLMGDMVHVMPVDDVAIPPASTVMLDGEGTHLELSPLTRPLEEGELFTVELLFETAEPVPVRTRVAAVSDADPADGHLHDQPFEVPDDEPRPTLSMTVEEGPDGWVLTLETENFAFDEAAADGPHQPGVGHAHLYIDDVKIGRLYGPVRPLEELTPGERLVRVTLNTNDHRTYYVDGVPVAAEVPVTVADPAGSSSN